MRVESGYILRAHATRSDPYSSNNPLGVAGPNLDKFHTMELLALFSVGAGRRGQ